MERSEELIQRIMNGLYRIGRGRHAVFQEELPRYGVTLQQFHLLLYLKLQGGAKVSEVGRMMMVSTPTASRMVNALQRAGLVKKEKSPRDQRAAVLTLTRRGSKLVERVRERQNDFLISLLHDIPDRDLEAFLRVIEMMAEKMAAGRSAEDGGGG
jgi:DNA-binding MarR family transcriptional regulator